MRAEQRTRRRRGRRKQQQQLCRATRPEHAAQLTTFQPVRSLNWALLFSCSCYRCVDSSSISCREIGSAACKRWLLLFVVVDGLPSCRQPRRYSARGSDYFPHGFSSGAAPIDRPTDCLAARGRTGIDGKDNNEVRVPPLSMWWLPTVPSFSPSPTPLGPTRVRLRNNSEK